MTTYKEILGKQVKNFTSDPANDAEGQVWYNSTSGTFKSVLATGAWSAGGNLITARRVMAGFGEQTSAVAAGGLTTISVANTEEYNGSGWSAGGNLGTARRQLAGAGTQTSGLAFAGNIPPYSNATEEYNGSAWTAGGNITNARGDLAGAGTQTAALGFGGSTYPGPVSNSTEEYDGSAWTAGGNYGTATYLLAGAGTQTAGLGFGGYNVPGGRTAVTEEYNGSAWTAGGNLGTSRYRLAGAGIQTSALAIGGITTPGTGTTGATEAYDGTSWTTTSSLATARRQLSGAGSNNTAGLAFGGLDTAVTSATEEYNFSATVTTGAAWSSGGNLNTGGQNIAGSGTKDAGLAGGRRTGASSPFSQSGATEEYDGSSWTSVNSMVTARGEGSMAGTQTASILFGGQPLPSNGSLTENYDGTNWTTSPATLNNGRASGASFGASDTSVVFAGGSAITGAFPANARSNSVEEYNGTAWTASTNLPIVRYNAGGAGVESAGIVLGGGNATGTVSLSSSDEYNGSTWTTGGEAPILIEGQGMNGSLLSARTYGAPSQQTITFLYDGTTFATSASIATGRSDLGATKSAPSSLSMGFGGSSPPNRQMNNTEEFTGETTAVNVKTLTTS